MIVAITEVVDIVPLDGIYTVIDRSFRCSLSRSCEISLESGGSSVKDRDLVGVVSPAFSESLFKLGPKFFKGITFGLFLQAELKKLFVGNYSRDDGLDDVGSVKAVHAVRPHDARLFLLNFDIFRGESLHLVEAKVTDCLEMSVRVKLRFDSC